MDLKKDTIKLETYLLVAALLTQVMVAIGLIIHYAGNNIKRAGEDQWGP